METPQLKRKTIKTTKQKQILIQKDGKKDEDISIINPEHINCTFQNDNYIIDYYNGKNIII